MRWLAPLRVVSRIVCLVIILAGLVFAAVQHSWVEVAVIVVGVPLSMYAVRNDGPWFR